MSCSSSSRLHLDLHGYRALERFSVTVAEVIGGYPIAADAWRDTPREVLEIGAAGIALFDRQAWPNVLTHLWHAWGVLASPSLPPNERSLPITLRVGAQLVEWLGYSGENRRALTIVQELLSSEGRIGEWRSPS